MLWRLLGYVFSSMCLVFVTSIILVAYGLWHLSRDLPDHEHLARYEPPVTTRIHAADGSLLVEYAKERRLYLPIGSIPKRLIYAFLAAEDKNFYDHQGVDYESILSAIVINMRNIGTGRRLVGASTITQQVAKNFLLTNELSYERKIKEGFLAIKIESTFSKDKILELYLNEIYLGIGSYGVAAASLNYFGKSVTELNVQETAYLAALPKAPNNYHPIREEKRAKARRNWVIERMQSNGYITAKEAEKAKATPLGVNLRSVDPHTFVAGYFAEEVRRQVQGMYGESKLYEGGLSVRGTLDPTLQVMARKALVDGLVAFDRQGGWRGSVTRIVPDRNWQNKLLDIPALSDIAPWRMGVVLSVNRDEARIGMRPDPLLIEAGHVVKEERITLQNRGVSWALKKGKPAPTISSILAVGDVIYVAPVGPDSSWELMQIPEIEGALVALDPHTGRVRAMVGGFSHDASEFNRATQALRQPGSAFKPFVYLAALENGYTPSSIIMDAPVEIEQAPGLEVWRPRNYNRTFSGPSTLRYGLEQSRNLMTVNLAMSIGMPLVVEYGRRLGIYDDLMPVLSMSLGAGETTLLRLTAAYAMLCNGGQKVLPTLIDRIQDRWGKTIFRHDTRECRGCELSFQDEGQPYPVLDDNRDQVVHPYSAYQITAIMEGVIQRGTGSAVLSVGKQLAGKTGTSNEERDAWFIGYSPDLVAGVFVGYDKPRPMGKGATGGRIAAPIFRDFMSMALANKPTVPFRIPSGIQLFRVNAKTGLKAGVNERGTIMEVFKPGTAPPGQHSMIGYHHNYQDEGHQPPSPPAANHVPFSPGVGGLY